MQSAEHLDTAPITALVVDDSHSARRMMRRMLEGAGYTVHEASDGQTALALLRCDLQHYVVWLDYSMPVLDGWDLLRTLDRDAKTLLSRHTFIFMTADTAALPTECHRFLHEHDIPLVDKPIPLRVVRVQTDAAVERLTH